VKASVKTFMHELAEGSGKILLKYFQKVKHIEKKDHAGIVTEADKFAEDYLIKRIFKKFPESSIITEESGEHGKGASLCWVLDPLDGTTNYAHGFPWFCVSIGLYEDDRPKAGMIYHPITKELFYAEADKGVWLNNKKVSVSKVDRMEDSLLGTGFYYSKGETLRREMEIFRRVNEVALGVRRPGSAALDLAFVACGRYDGFWERGLAPWDVAAGLIMVTEAGGKLSDYSGKEVNLNSGEIVASNGKLHQQMISLIS